KPRPCPRFRHPSLAAGPGAGGAKHPAEFRASAGRPIAEADSDHQAQFLCRRQHSGERTERDCEGDCRDQRSCSHSRKALAGGRPLAGPFGPSARRIAANKKTARASRPCCSPCMPLRASIPPINSGVPPMDKIALGEKFAMFTEHWRPKVVGRLNGQEVKL